MREIIIDKEQNKTIIALLENGKLIEKYEESDNTQNIEGNIYCGVVKNIFPGMQMAFVDIGKNKNAFIHIKDIIPKINNKTGNKEEKFYRYKINDYLKLNMKVLVQVKKDQDETKSAKVSKNISLTGRLAVLMFGVEFVTVSQKIENEDERNRLIKLTEEIKKEINEEEKYGVILRTGSENKKKEEIKEEINKLIELSKKIKKAFLEARNIGKPSIIYENYNMILKFLIGILETPIDRIIVNTQDIYQYVIKYLKSINKNDVDVEFNDKGNIMEFNQLGHQIKKMEERKIWLKCGGFITIDKTEALTAIDVNSGKFTGKKSDNKEETILKVNQEATIEIAKQLRLRNISGIIVIDYIDMEENEERKTIINLLEKELKKDRSKTQLIGFTKLDLLEMTRKKI